MNSKNKFTVAHSKSSVVMILCGAGVFILLPIAFTVFQGIQHSFLYVFCGMCALPFLLAGFRLKLYKISVFNTTISVRKGLFKKFSLDVTEINNIKWRIALTKFGANQVLCINAKAGKFKVETLMVGSEKMIDFLKDNVDESKIKGIIKDFA